MGWFSIKVLPPISYDLPGIVEVQAKEQRES